MIIINSAIPSFKEKLKQSYLYNFTRVFIVILVLAIFLNITANLLCVFFYIASLVLFQLSIFKFSIFKTFIYELAFEEESNSIIIKYSTGMFFVKYHEYKVNKGNFNIKYYRNSQWYPVFIIEQRKPYKLILNQYCFSIWKDKNSLEILKKHCNKLEYLN